MVSSCHVIRYDTHAIQLHLTCIAKIFEEKQMQGVKISRISVRKAELSASRKVLATEPVPEGPESCPVPSDWYWGGAKRARESREKENPDASRT